MSTILIIGIIGAGAGILFVGTLLRALGKTRASSSFEAAIGSEPVRRLRIHVKGGYEPELIELDRGIPVVLEFEREEDDPCSERVILDGFNRNVYLPPFEITEVKLVPEDEGSFEFACGMGKLKGRIRVRGS